MAGEREARDALNGLSRLSPAIETLRAVLAKAFTADRAAIGVRRAPWGSVDPVMRPATGSTARPR